ncbi:MAG: transcription antitermination protein NusB [Clostridia bacterium]|nr:transcription antitermination protein NusB [Clostridia bacterium]
MRSLAREIVFKSIFSRLFNPSDEGLFEVLSSKLNDEDKKFAKSIYDDIVKNENEYFTKINDLVKNFKFDRIFNADKCAILIGISEMNLYKDTPLPVIIDEAVKLSFIFSTEKSTDFVNGVLAQYSKEI